MSRMFGDHNVAFIAPFLIVLFGLPIPALAQSCPPFTSCINEGTLTFSNQVVGTVSAGQLITFTSWGSGYISGLSGVTGDFSEGPRTTCPPTFQSGCQIEILFTPTLVGTRPGRLTLTFFGNLSNLMQFWDLTGTGVTGGGGGGGGTALLKFGQQLVGTTSSPQQVPGCCFNSAYGSSVDLGISISGDFRRDPHTTCGFSLGPLQSCVIWVAFAPQQVGTLTGQVTTSAVVTYPTFTPHPADLTGTGILPTPPPPLSPCDINMDGQTNAVDVQLLVNQLLGIVPAPATADVNGDGVVNVLDLQRVINAVLGLGCHSGP